MITLVTNLKAGAATTQYTNFYYNSMVKFNHKYLCANSDGLFEVTGDTDNGSALRQKSINDRSQSTITDTIR